MKISLKTIICVYFLIIWNCITYCQPKTHVDERFELTSIAFRLTDENCFVHSEPELYVRDIDFYFSKYKNHEFIQYIKKTMYAKPVIAFNYITDLAADIKITTNGIIFNDEWITNYETDNCNVAKGDWTKAELSEYIRLLNKFYKDTKFHKFYDSHADFYAAAEKNLQELLNQIDTAWFSNFFGQPFEMTNIWLVPSNGRNNFALYRTDTNGKQYNNCAIGCSSTDSLNHPTFNFFTFETIIHEICHNYNNPICDKYNNAFKNICDTIYHYVGDLLANNYYGNPSNILYEGLNRFCEYSYLLSHESITPPFPLISRIRLEEKIGYVWLEEMLRYRDVFMKQRDVFPTYESFIPQLQGFMQQVAKNMNGYYAEKLRLQAEKPRVIATFPANGSVVDTNITEVVIYFSHPMTTNCLWRNYDEQSGALPLPTVEKNDEFTTYWKDSYTYVIPLTLSLKPHSNYSFRVPNNFPRNDVYYNCCEQYDLTFSTK